MLLTPDGVALRSVDGSPLYGGGEYAQVTAPDVASLSLTGHIPAVEAAASLGIQPAPFDLSAAGFASHALATDHRIVLPPLAQVTLTGLQPAAVATAHRWATPDRVQIEAAGYAPTTAATDHKWVRPVIGSLLFEGIEPLVSADASLTMAPVRSQIAVSSFAPGIAYTAHQWALPDTAGILASGMAATVVATAHRWALPALSEVSVACFSPNIARSDHKLASPGLADIEISGHVSGSMATANYWATTGRSQLAIVGNDVAVTADASIILQVARAEIYVLGLQPTAGTSDHQEVFPPRSEIIVDGLAPVALAPRRVLPDHSELDAAGFAPVLRFAIRVQPNPSVLGILGIIPVVLQPVRASAGTGLLTFATYTPAIAANASVRVYAGLPSMLALTGISPTVTADASIVLGPAHAALVITGRTPTLAQTDRKWVLPGVSGILLSGTAATVINPQSASPDLAEILLAAYSPDLGISEDQFARPGQAALALTGFPSAFVAPQTVWPGEAGIAISGYAPQSRGGQSVHPEAAPLILDAFEPTAVVTEDQFARLPGGAAMTIESDVPFIVLPRVRFPGVAVMAMLGFAPLSHAIIPVALMDFTARPGGEMTGVIVKHPWAEVRVAVDWSPYVERQQTIVTQSEWVETTDLETVLDGPFVSNSVASVEIGGGLPASAPIVENRVQFADGSRDVFRVRVQVAGTA